MRAEREVVIVGGGPAGLATAIELRRRDLEVVLVERAAPPIDKACGEGLMPDGVERLAALGVVVEELDSAPLTGIRYIGDDVRAEASFGRRLGRGIRRLVLQRALAGRAGQVGVELLWNTPVRGLAGIGPMRDGVVTDHGVIRARWIIGADGLHSRVRRWAGIATGRARFCRWGLRRHFGLAPWTDRVEVYWGDHTEAYVTPVSSTEVGVAFLWSGARADFAALLERFPGLREQLGDAASTSSDRGAGQLEQRCRAAHRGNIALVGDAAGYRDAITGEGLSLAFHEAAALAAAIDRDDLARYEREVARLTRLPFLLIRLLLEAERRPGLRRRLLLTLATEPALFERLLAVHTGALPPHRFGASGLLQLARGLLGQTA